MPKNIALTDFGGGMRQDASSYGPNECANLSGFWPQAGGLEPMKGPRVVIDGATGGNDRDELTIYSMGAFTNADGQAFLLARRASSLWIAVPEINYDRPYSATYACVTLWDMRAVTENLEDQSPYYASDYVLVNHGTQQKLLWSGRVRSFRGTDYLALADTAFLNFANAERGISFWMRADSPPASGSFYSLVTKKIGGPSHQGYAVVVHSSGAIKCAFYEDLATNKWVARTATTNVCDGDWHHIAVTYAGSTVPTRKPTIYVDGAADTIATEEGTAAAYNTNSASYFTVGYNAVDSYGFVGDMGTLSFHNAELSAAYVAAQYAAELPRYQDPATITYTWYPLHGGSFIGDSKYGSLEWLPARSTVSGETFQQVGDYHVYCASDSPDAKDYMLAWRAYSPLFGTIIRRGLVVGTAGVYGTTPGRFQLTGTFYSWYGGTTGRVMVGDVIYIKDYSLDPANGGKWRLHGHVVKYAPNTQGDDLYVCDLGFDTTGKGPGPSNTCEYCIVRMARPGVAELGPCHTTTAAGGSLAAATYQYMCRLVNDETGYVGKFSDVSTIVVPLNNKVSINRTAAGEADCWELQPTDQDAHRLEVWRKKGSGPFYSIAIPSLDTETLGIPAALGGAISYYYRANFAAAYEDTGYANGTQLTDTDYASYDRPGAFSNIRLHNQRLYASAGHQEWCSLLDPGYEYWPAGDARLAIYSTKGGFADIGEHIGESVVGAIAEGGSYESNGVGGSNLLVLTNRRGVRWFGYDYTDFELVPAFAVGCIARRTLTNCAGTFVWSSGDHIMALPMGSNTPVIISEKMWPYGIRYYITAADKERCLAAWSAAYWNGWYVLSGSLSDYEPDTTWLCRIVPGREPIWTSYPYGYTDLLDWEMMGTAGGRFLVGAVESAAAATGDVAGLWEHLTAFNYSMTTRPLELADEELDLIRSKGITRVTGVWRLPLTANATVTCTGYADGDLSTPLSSASSATLSYVATVGKTGLARWSGAGGGRYLQLVIAGSGTSAPRLLALVAQSQSLGNA